MTPTPLHQLVQNYLEGLSSPEELAQLNERLRTDAAARREFLEIVNLDSALAEVTVAVPSLEETNFAADAPETLATEPSGRSSSRWSVTLGVAASLAICLLLGAFGYYAYLPPAQLAIVENAAGLDFVAGAKVGRRTYEITAGTLELVTNRGARVVIEAPARFTFQSEQLLQLDYGRLAADVPPAAKGFTVITPSGKAVDLGTKFGVDMPQGGNAEVHVFQGEVIASSTTGDDARNLKDGEALRFAAEDQSPANFRSAAFIQPGEVVQLHAALQAGQQVRSVSEIEKLRDDPDLISLIDFESDVRLPGNYRTVQGRWPGSKAAELVNIGEHVKLNVGGEHPWPQLTLAAWVRLDHLGEPYQSLLHTDGWDKSRKGQVHWMATKQSTMRLALRDNKLAPTDQPNSGFPDSQIAVLPEQGRWVHLAAVYDADKQTVRFYFNGQFDNEVALSQAYPGLLGSAQIGNWNEIDRKLSGRVDELLIMGRAMSDKEMQALYDAGNPYH